MAPDPGTEQVSPRMPSPILIQTLPTPVAVRVTRELRGTAFRRDLPPPIGRLAEDFYPPLKPTDLHLLSAAIAGCEKWKHAPQKKYAINKQKNLVRKLRRELVSADEEEKKRTDAAIAHESSVQFFLTNKGMARLQAIFLHSFALERYGTSTSDIALEMCASIMLFSKRPNRTAFSFKEIWKQAEAIRGRFRTLTENRKRAECEHAGEHLMRHVQRLAALPGASWQGVAEVTEPNMVEDTEP